VVRGSLVAGWHRSFGYVRADLGMHVKGSEWHRKPKDGAWRDVHLAHVASLGSRLWLRCNDCGHSVTPPPGAFAEAHDLEMTTSLLIIARRLRCTRCGARKAICWPEPYGIPTVKRSG